jgi:UDP-N-acetylmuramoylalanine-D-glutamate ligase
MVTFDPALNSMKSAAIPSLKITLRAIQRGLSFFQNSEHRFEMVNDENLGFGGAGAFLSNLTGPA